MILQKLIVNYYIGINIMINDNRKNNLRTEIFLMIKGFIKILY